MAMQNPVVTNGSRHAEHTKLPEFGSHALKTLTSTIQSNLRATGTPAHGKQSKTGAKGGKAPKKAVGDVKNGSRPGPKQVQLKSSRQDQSVSAHHQLEQKSSDSQASGASKKRLRNGDVKSPQEQEERLVKSERNPQSPAKAKEGRQGKEPDIRKEIQALGGEDADYELIKGLDSESEIEGPQKKDVRGDLLKELKQYVGELGISDAQEDDALSTSSEEAEWSAGGQDGEYEANGSTIGDQNGASGRNDALVGPGTSIPLSLSKAKLHIEPLAEWHMAELDLLPKPGENQRAASSEQISLIHEHAKELLDQENQNYIGSRRSASSSHQFYTEIMTTGTLSDKIGALTLSIQESPLHNMKALENLLSLARKRSRAQAVDVLGALKDLFGPGSLLPSDRKLCTFVGQPQLHALLLSRSSWRKGNALPKPLNQAHLIFWAFEDWLKSIFFEVLQILETWCNDEVVFARGRAVDYVFSLLQEKPEQEANLLRLLVNKLGDTDKKVASKTSYHMLQLETTHPAMKSTIISSIEADLLFRPGQSLHAQYYAAITLNQTVLSQRETDVAKKLIAIYFALFLRLLTKPKDDTISAQKEPKAASVKLNKKGEVQGGGSAPGKAALQKQARETKSGATKEDLRDKMVAAVLTGVNRAIPYISTDDESFDQHLDTLFRVTHSSNFNTAIQALMLIQQIQGSGQTVADRFYRTLYESLLDPRLLTSSKQVLYLNLLYRSLRADLNVDRIKAFTKRMTQVTSMHQPSFTCGVLYLIRELENTFPSLKAFIDQHEEDAGDDEEIFRDVPEEGTDLPMPQRHSTNRKVPGYTPHKRDPLHAGAASSTLWDIQPLLQHYHPSVSLFASRLLSHDLMPPKPDLNLNTLAHFLEKFVYKNPKTSVAKKDTLKGHSLMQPLASNENSGAVLVSKGGNRVNIPVNADEFWKKEAESVGADDVFFHRYFSQVGQRKEKKALKREMKKDLEPQGVEADLGEGGDIEDEDEDEIWKALVGSNPEVAGEGLAEEGIDIDELEGYSDEEDEDEDAEILDDGDDDAAAEADDFPDFLDDEGADDLVDSDVEIPDGMDLDDTMDADGARKHLDEQHGKLEKNKKKSQRQRLKNLPTFASVEDYERLLGEEDDDEGIA